MAPKELTQDYLRSLFTYDPETGVLRWKWRPRGQFASKSAWVSANARFAGKEVGHRTGTHLRSFIGKRAYYVHRLIWVLVTGKEPIDIDHIDGDGYNNAWVNLREATHSQNMRNMRRSKRNTSGVTGVAFHKASGRWIAYIRTDGRRKHIGYFNSLQDAAAARAEAEKRFGYHDNHGRD